MVGKLTTADAAYEAVPKDTVTRRCPRRPPRRLCQGKMPRKPCPREFAKKAAPKDATKEAANKKSTKNGVPNTLPEPWPPWWDGQQGPAQPGTGQHHQHKVHKAEQPEAKKPKVEQPKGQLEVEQHHPEPQTKVKEGVMPSWRRQLAERAHQICQSHRSYWSCVICLNLIFYVHSIESDCSRSTSSYCQDGNGHP